MAEYIEKAAILSKCEEMWNNADETTQTGVDTINAIDRITDFIEAIPASDVQPVVRCKDCKERPHCLAHSDDFFCAFGERSDVE